MAIPAAAARSSSAARSKSSVRPASTDKQVASAAIIVSTVLIPITGTSNWSLAIGNLAIHCRPSRSTTTLGRIPPIVGPASKIWVIATGMRSPGGAAGTFQTDDQGGDTDDGRTHTDEDTSGWTPERPDAVRLGTPKRNPVIARSVGEPL